VSRRGWTGIGRRNALSDAAQHNREMTAFSRFILITHHSKATMAVADTLYGVTMEDPGVSKVVSVRLQYLFPFSSPLRFPFL